MKCPECNTEVIENSKFCNSCGCPIEVANNEESVEVKQKFCIKCGNKIDATANFCLKCGHNQSEAPVKTEKVSKKDKSKITKVLLPVILIVVALLAGGGYLVYSNAVKQEAIREAERQRQELISNYQVTAKTLYNLIEEAERNFDGLSSMFETATDINVSAIFDADFFTTYTKGLCADRITAEESRRKVIDKKYDELKEIDCTEPEVKELSDAIEAYYDAYDERYELLVKGEFSVYSFDSENKKTKETYDLAAKTIKELVKDIVIE